MQNIKILVLQLICFSFIAVQAIDGHTIHFKKHIKLRRQPCDGFQCKSGDCIDEEKECDGIADCRDGSDETNSCHRMKCPSFVFRCKYGACINPDAECDGKVDCIDGSDEYSPKCKKDEASIIDVTTPWPLSTSTATPSSVSDVKKTCSESSFNNDNQMIIIYIIKYNISH